MQTLQIISHRIQCFSNDQILSMIDPETLERIKQKDEHPFFQAYSILHEGKSTPRIIGNTARPITWTRKAIQSVKNIITKGVKLFYRHNKDNSHDNRKVMGEIVADSQQEIDGKLNHVVITYHNPETRDKAKECDVCSHEGVWDFVEKGKELIADTIQELTGIALSNSNIEKPAFSGAKRLAMVQAFDKIINEDNIMSNETNDNTEEIRQIRQRLKELKVYPWQVYNADDLKKDRQFSNVDELKGLFDDYSELKSKNINLQKEVDTYKKQVGDFETKNKELEKKYQLFDAKKRLDNVISSENLTEKQKQFISNRFSENIEDLSDDGLKNFVKKEVEEYKEFAKYYDTNDKNLNLENKNEVDTEDLTKPENNPLIDED